MKPIVGTIRSTEAPEHDRLPEGELICPPHDFEAGWATPLDGGNENVPALWCRSCGDIRAFRIPDIGGTSE